MPVPLFLASSIESHRLSNEVIFSDSFQGFKCGDGPKRSESSDPPMLHRFLAQHLHCCLPTSMFSIENWIFAHIRTQSAPLLPHLREPMANLPSFSRSESSDTSDEHLVAKFDLLSILCTTFEPKCSGNVVSEPQK